MRSGIMPIDREPDVARKLIMADEILYSTATRDPDGSVHAEHEDEIRAEMQARDILPPPSPCEGA